MDLIEILKTEKSIKPVKKRKRKLRKKDSCWEHPYIKLVEDVPFGWQGHCPECNHQYVHHDNMYHNYINPRHPHITPWDKDYPKPLESSVS